MIRLGDKARDRITGFTGIVTGRTEWLNGCVRYQVQPEGVDKDGKPVEAQWFDEQVLERIGRSDFSREPVEAARAGGPKPDPKQPDPKW